MSLSITSNNGFRSGYAGADNLWAVYDSAPVAQAAAITSPGTTAATTTTGGCWGYSTSTQADAVNTAVRSILTALRNVGIINT